MLEFGWATCEEIKNVFCELIHDVDELKTKNRYDLIPDRIDTAQDCLVQLCGRNLEDFGPQLIGEKKHVFKQLDGRVQDGKRPGDAGSGRRESSNEGVGGDLQRPGQGSSLGQARGLGKGPGMPG